MQIQSVAVAVENKLNQVVMSCDFVIGASTDERIHAWDRRTGERRPYTTFASTKLKMMVVTNCIYICHAVLVIS
jgi:hypothetical protein